MLTHFPVIYPREWIYSVYCRYYIASGIKEHMLVKEELFGTSSVNMGTLFPNGHLAAFAENLPEGSYSFDDILTNHTLFNYYVRMYPKDEQEYIYKYLQDGGSPQLTHLWRSYDRASWKPRYCPICAKEDEKRYGEPYYHTEHQIPLAAACYKHGCRLKTIDIPETKWALRDRFYPLSQIELDYVAEVCKPWEQSIAALAMDYLVKPLKLGPTDGFNNIIQGLINKGYYKLSKAAGLIADGTSVRKALAAYYGEELTNQVFGKQVDDGMMLRIKRFEQLLPDRYILLQGLIGMGFDDAYERGPLEDNLKERLLAVKENIGFAGIKKVADAAGLKQYELRALCKEYGIEAFWAEKRSYSHDGTVRKKIVVTVTDDEYERLLKISKERGFERPCEYLVQVALHDII